MAGAWNPEKTEAFRENFYRFLGHIRISSKEKGQMILGENLYRAQVMFYETIFEGLKSDCHDFYFLKSRQLGISTGTRPLSLFWLGMHEGLRGALVFDSAFNTAVARREIEETIDGLPKRLNFPGIKSRNRDVLILENDSHLLFMQAGTKNSRAGGGLGRSLGLNFAHLSEISSWANEEGVVSFRQALAQDYPDRLYINESTARGYELWHKMWQDAKVDPYNKRTCFLGWWSKDNQIIAEADPRFSIYGEEPPNKRELERMRTVKELYDWEITPEQLAWYRYKTDPARELDEDDSEDGYLLAEQPWCLAAGTRVGTDRGILKIEDVPVGTLGSLGPIVRSGPTSTVKVWRARTALGYLVEGSANHPLIDAAGEPVELRSALGRQIKLCEPRFAENLYTVNWREGPAACAVDVTPDLGKLVGIYMGDGSVSAGGNAYSIDIACDAKDKDVVDECARLFRSVFGLEPNIGSHDPHGTGGWTRVRLSSRPAVELFKKLGLTRNDTVKTMRKVHVPEFIWRSPRDVVAKFLSGLFEADGYNGYETDQCKLFSKYEDFLRDVQILLLGFGITSRRTGKIKKSGNGKDYIGYDLHLRAEAARLFNAEIGFISKRKIERPFKNHPRKDGRKGRNCIPNVMLDEIVSVEETDREETVYNLTIDGTHLYDANGILTHNCEEEAFQSTGSSFFMGEKITEANARLADEPRPKPFRFWPGIDFVTCDIQPARTKRDTEFRMWEEPVNDSMYIVAADPAFGRDEKNDNSAVQVMRCYADAIDQVGEYASASIQPHQLSWLLWTLIGYYGSTRPNCRVMFICEINGPGEEVWRQFQATETIVRNGYLRTAAREKGIGDIFGNMQRYFFQRSDSLSAGTALMFKTTTQSKVQLMEACRNYMHNNTVLVRSPETLEEMRTITRDGDAIAAEGNNRDDRTFALALAIRAWDEKVRRQMIAGNRTKEAERARLSVSIEDQWQIFRSYQLSDFFRKTEAARGRANMAAARASWRSGPGRRW